MYTLHGLELTLSHEKMFETWCAFRLSRIVVICFELRMLLYCAYPQGTLTILFLENPHLQTL